MTDKECLEYIENCLDDDFNYKNATREKDKLSHSIILNLIKKQSKEIEDNKKYIDLHYVPYEQYVSTTNGIDKKWKDKIKAKIEEYRRLLYSYEKDLKEKLHYVDKESMNCIIAQIQVLQSLLEKE